MHFARLFFFRGNVLDGFDMFFLKKYVLETLESQFLYEAFGLGGQMLTVVGNRYRIRRR